MKARVLVHHAVVERFGTAASSCSGRAEEGGILLGSYREGGMELTGFTEAAARDRRGLLRFVRQDRHHRDVATREWRASGGTVTMTGEWHTHPFGEPCPSATDLRTWRGVLLRATYPKVFVIAAPGQWRAWLGSRRRASTILAPLHQAEHGTLGVVLCSDEPGDVAGAVATEAGGRCRDYGCP